MITADFQPTNPGPVRVSVTTDYQNDQFTAFYNDEPFIGQIIIGRGDTIIIQSDKQYAAIRYDRRPEQIKGTFPVRLFHNGLPLSDILAEEATRKAEYKQLGLEE